MATELQNSQAPADQRAQYTAPGLETLQIDRTNKLSRLSLDPEILAQINKISLATSEEIHDSLAEALSNPKIRYKLSGPGAKLDDGRIVNTPLYFLTKFSKANPTTQDELVGGFGGNLERMKIARANANNQSGNFFHSRNLKIEATSDRQSPRNSEWRATSSRVNRQENFEDPTTIRIYEAAKQIKVTDALFVEAPQFSQLIVGALTDLPVGVTLEEFSVVTGLSEDDILKTVDHLNKSVFPNANADIKIHNRNGILIFGTRAWVPVIDTHETRTETMSWKAVIAAMRKKVANTQAVALDPEPAGQPEQPEQKAIPRGEPAAAVPLITPPAVLDLSAATIETLTKQLADSQACVARGIDFLAQAHTRNYVAEQRALAREQRETDAIARATTAEAEVTKLRQAAPSSELLARVRSAATTIEEKSAQILKLEAELLNLRERMNQVRVTTERNARHDTREEVEAEFEGKLAEKEAEIKALKKSISDLNGQIAGLQGQLRKSPDVQVAELQTVLAKSQAETAAANKRAAAVSAELTVEKAKPARETVSPEAQKTITVLEGKLAELQKQIDQQAKQAGADLISQALFDRQMEALTATEKTLAETKTSLNAANRELRTLEGTGREKDATIQGLKDQIERQKQAIKSKNTTAASTEKKGEVDSLKAEVVALKTENLGLRRLQDKSAGDGTATLQLTITSLRLELAKEREKTKAKPASPVSPAAPKRDPLARVVPDFERAKEAAEWEAKIQKSKPSLRPELKELSNLIQTIQTAETTSLPLGINETIIAELNSLVPGVHFTETGLIAIRNALNMLVQVISANKAFQKSPDITRTRSNIQEAAKYIQGILSMNDQNFQPERKSGIVRRVSQLLNK